MQPVTLATKKNTTQCPSYHPPPRIPNETFQPENGEGALDFALELLQKVNIL